MTVVLVPIDGSDRALRAVPWAAKLVGPDGKILLLRVVPAQTDAALAEANGGLDEAARFAGPGVAVERLVASGEPDAEIVATAAGRGVDVIAMSSHGRGAIGRALFGSVADRVSRSATVPVLILRTPTNEPASGDEVAVQRIVVPLDGSAMAERALPIATSLSRRLGVPIHVVRAVDAATVMPVVPGVFGTAPVVSAEITDRVWQEAEAEAKKTVSNAVSSLQRDGFDATGALLNGSPFFAISEAVQAGDLLVLTSHGRGGVRRWLLGSVAEKLVREAPVPVVLVPAAERVGTRELEAEIRE
jgi:nucleotide-binding universal stress UspA family protein